jgi:hypothetical protein
MEKLFEGLPWHRIGSKSPNAFSSFDRFPELHGGNLLEEKWGIKRPDLR